MTKKITKIKTQKRKGRYNVYLNNHYAFPISESVMIKYRVFKGMEIDDDLKNKLIHADDVSKLYNRAIDYLANQLRTENEVRQKIASLSDDNDAIEKVVDHLKRENLINDRNYANSYVRTKMRINLFGPDKIKRQLKLKHIDHNLIDNAIAHNYDHRELIDNGIVQAKKIFKRHRRDAFRKRIQKTKVGLMRKGFDYQSIDQILNQVNFVPNEDEQNNLLYQNGVRIWHHMHAYHQGERIMKTKQKLYRKGFSMDDINNLIDHLIQN